LPSTTYARRSALERAADDGYGPLSPIGIKVWHGEGSPCVSCGELNRRSDMTCRHCGQDLSLQMVTRMQAHAGPWYVLEHVRPFPGVTLERLVRQIRRGILTGTTIVRGPTTYHQWRFAAESPGISKYLGVCWNCQGPAREEETYCSVCGVNLDRPPGEMPEETQSSPVPSSELAQLNAAVRSTVPAADLGAEQPRRGISTVAIIAAILIVAMAVLVAVIQLREKATAPKPAVAPTPVAVIPTPG
jgi:hypothetical protein